MLTRRLLMGAGGATIALAACGQSAGVKEAAKSVAKTGMRKIDKVGIQTYTVREALGQDFKGTFQMLKDVGYDYVEINERNYENHSAEQLRDILSEVGLPSPSTHVGYEELVGDTDGVIARAKTMDCKFIVLPYIHEHQRSLADWKGHAQMFNQVGRKTADKGIQFAYHNHQFEFDDLGGGTTAMEVLMNECSPELVQYELDFFWANLASQDIPALIKRYPGRFKLCHIKDMKGDPKEAIARGDSYDTITNTIMVDVGEGDIDFTEYFALNDISGMEYFIAEHDSPKAPYRDAVATSLQSIRNMRF